MPRILFKGRYKKDIIAEAFRQHGPTTTKAQVDQHLRSYGVKKPCNESTFYRIRRFVFAQAPPATNGAPTSNGQPHLVVTPDSPEQEHSCRRRLRLVTAGTDAVVLFDRMYDLACDMGGMDRLEAAVRTMQKVRQT